MTSKPAALYARTGSPWAHSLDAQIAECRALAEQHGWDVKVYADKAASGLNPNRASYRALIDDIEAGTVDKVILPAIEILGRDIAEIARFFDLADARQVRVFINGEETSHQGRAMAYLRCESGPLG